MKMSNYTNLGAVVTEIEHTREQEGNDYEMDGSGECGRMISNGWNKTRDQIVQRHGFANMHHFLAVVESRTGKRWVYFNLGGL